MDSLASRCAFPMPIWLRYSWFSALFCCDAGTIILLPVMVIPSMITNYSLNEHYGCMFPPHLDFVGGQQCNTYSDRMPKCSSSRFASLPSTVMHSGISVHDSTAFMVIHIPGISLSMFDS